MNTTDIAWMIIKHFLLPILRQIPQIVFINFWQIGCGGTAVICATQRIFIGGTFIEEIFYCKPANPYQCPNSFFMWPSVSRIQ